MIVLSIEAAAGALADSAVVGLPTDTVYGLAADPFSEGAMGKLYDVKGRPANKPVGFLAADATSAQELVKLPRWAVKLADQHWPGPLTLVGKAAVLLPDWSAKRYLRTIGIRVPAHPVTQELLKRTGPLAVTSANLSGGEESTTHEEAYAILGDAIAGYVEGSRQSGVASTVIDATRSKPKIIRQGAVQI